MRARILLTGIVALLVAAYLPSVLAAEVKSNATVKNRNPVVEAIFLDTSDDDPGTAGMQVAPTPGGNRTIPIGIRVSDGNGWNDVTRVSYRVLAAVGGPLKSGDAARDGDGTGRMVTYTGEITIPFWQAPGNYTVEATVEDRTGQTTTATWNYEVVPTLAMVLDSASVSFGGPDGELEPGMSNRQNPAMVLIRNLGNTEIDLGFSGTDLESPPSYGATIPVNRLKYSAKPDLSDERPFSKLLQTDSGFNLKPGPDAVRPVFFVLQMPTGDEQYVPATTYQGGITLSAVVSS